MEALDLFNREGFLFSVLDGGLNVRSVRPLSSEQRAQLKEHKAEIIELLSRQKVQEVVTGFPCRPCGNSLYRKDVFKWRDQKGEYHKGFKCLECGTNYWFV